MPISLLYRYLVVFEIFVAEYLFIQKLRKRKLFWLRLFGAFAADILLASVLPLIYNEFYMSFVFVLLFAATVPALKFCYEESFINIFFCAIAGYTVQHFSYGVANLMLTLIEQGSNALGGLYFDGRLDFSKIEWQTVICALIYVIAYFISYTTLYYIFGRKIKRGENLRISNKSILALVSAGLIIDICLYAISVYHIADSNMIIRILIIVYEEFCCFFLLYVQFGLVKTSELENELSLAYELLREKERQYNLSKDNIELINVKCHDMRHQIRTIGKTQGLSSAAVKEIENAISVYDAEVRTGNDVLDIILTEKSLKCTHENIELTCVADGNALAFMEETDIYSLFGNALDNAIEAASALEIGKRLIGVIVRINGDMVSVNVYNTYTGTVRLDADGMPVTAKNKDYHGIGMQSIRRTAEKYGGSANVTVDGETFNLFVLMPKQDGKN